MNVCEFIYTSLLYTAVEKMWYHDSPIINFTSVSTVWKRTVEVASVILRLQLRDELGLLPQETVPVQITKEAVLFHLKRTPCETEREEITSNIFREQSCRITSKKKRQPFQDFLFWFIHTLLISLDQGIGSRTSEYM